jgi:alkanesulfonate monooxygenase SsuD/methylene tetrahydromethanopterin reductase-like flavin-dependent oxidoreductase (luciferase family)
MSYNLIKFGVLLPTREAVMSGRADPSSLYRMAERAEALGFHSVWVGDSLTARPRIDALTMLAAVGARTSRVRLGTAIFLAALRHPILLAYQLASLDWITGGRVDFGIGYGRRGEPSQEEEFKILGLDAGSRIKRSEEAVHVMRRLWRENNVSYEGKFSSFKKVTLEPKPIQPAGVPIWLASNDVEAGLRRVGCYGDAWINNIKDPGIYHVCWEKVRAYASEAGRDPEVIEPGAYFTLAAGDRYAIEEGQRFLAEYYNRSYDAIVRAQLCITGTWDNIIDRLEAFRAAGARTAVLRFAGRDQIGQLEACAEAFLGRGLLNQS